MGLLIDNLPAFLLVIGLALMLLMALPGWILLRTVHG